jgi:predicted Zn-dependent protease
VKISPNPFGPPDSIHFRASEGWLELGNHLEANEELEQITPEMRAHPAVLCLRYEIYAKGKKWEGAAEIAQALVNMLPEQPQFWINLAYSTRRKTDGGILPAKEVLMEAKAKFQNDYLITYNLACYECQLGNLKGALQKLGEAIDLAGKIDIRLMALDDPDLEPIWLDIAQI